MPVQIGLSLLVLFACLSVWCVLPIKFPNICPSVDLHFGSTSFFVARIVSGGNKSEHHEFWGSSYKCL